MEIKKVMKRVQQYVVLILTTLCLLAGSAANALAQEKNPNDPVRPTRPPIVIPSDRIGDIIREGPKVSDPQPNTISGQIRWIKEMGVPSQPGYDNPCARFQMSVTETVGAPGTLGSQDKLYGWQIDNRMGDGGNYYFCTFKVTVPFNHRIRVVALFRHEALGESVDTTTWTGGSQAQAPPGYQRVIINAGRSVTLTESKPYEVLTFDVGFVPISMGPR
jgi:hypothetical protein